MRARLVDAEVAHLGEAIAPADRHRAEAERRDAQPGIAETAAVPCPQGYLDHATRENGRLKRDKAWTRRLSSRDAGDVLDAPSRAWDPICVPRVPEDAGVHARRGSVAGDRHRREHRHLQRRERAAAPAAAVPGRRPPRSSCGIDRPASASRKTGSRRRSISTSRRESPRLRRASRSRSARNYNLTGDGEPGADRHDPRLVEPAADARRARRHGRLFDADDDRAGPNRHGGAAATRRGCGATAAIRGVIGRSIMLNGQPFEIVGVLPAVVLAAARGHADARRRRGRGDPAAAAARGRTPPSSATARTTTSSAG